MNKLYFRHSAFPGRGYRNLRGNESSPCTDRSSPGDPASRFVLSIGSLVILDRVASSRINQLLYTFNPSASNGSVVPHNTDTPLLRAAVVCWRVPIDTKSASNATSPDPCTEADSRDLELEAKISVQPLKINVDQVCINSSLLIVTGYLNHIYICSIFRYEGPHAIFHVMNCPVFQPLPARESSAYGGSRSAGKCNIFHSAFARAVHDY